MMSRPPLSAISDPGSFRDPSGQVWRQGGSLFRSVNRCYRANYDQLMVSGLYDHLVSEGLLVPHHEVDCPRSEATDTYKTLQPQPVRFVSYPYEWCFGQLQDAALATLRIQRVALEYGMTLKDASAYNIQFVSGAPILIDTLSFEKYREGRPWIAYRQFCQHFLAPLAIMAYADVRLGQLLRSFVDGLPLDLAVSLLPVRARWRPSLLAHLVFHARAQRRYEGKAPPDRFGSMPRRSLLGLIDNLHSLVSHLKPHRRRSAFDDYYSDNAYSPDAMAGKTAIVDRYLKVCGPGMVWDFGSNSGRFSRLALQHGGPVIAFDSNPNVIEQIYERHKHLPDGELLPLVVDCANPSPGIGWNNQERLSLKGRGGARTVMVLALLHHLRIGASIPFEMISEFLQSLAPYLIVEFIPKSDSQVRRLLASRDDCFSDYSLDHFEECFHQYYRFVTKNPIPDSDRVLYLMRRRQ